MPLTQGKKGKAEPEIKALYIAKARLEGHQQAIGPGSGQHQSQENCVSSRSERRGQKKVRSLQDKGQAGEGNKR